MSEGSADSPLAQWQRLSPWAVVFLFTRGVTRFARENLPLLVGAGAGAAFIEDIGLAEVVLGVTVLLLLAGLISLQYYRRFRFHMEGDVLLVQKGLIERTELKVSADRVQHIAIDQPAYMRPFDVVRFSVDTPGGITTEVELPGIPRPVAEDLRQRLGNTPLQSAQGTSPESADGIPLYQVTSAGLILHGLASNYAYLVAAALAPVLQPVEQIARRRVDDPSELEFLRPFLENPALALAMMLPALVLVMMLASIGFAWLRFFGFQLTQHPDRFVQYSGLLTRREQTLSTSKLQSVEWVQTAVGRLLGRGYLVCRQYSGLSKEAEQFLGQSFIIPGVDPATAQRLRQAFWPGLAAASGFRRVDPFYRRVLAIRIGLPAAGIVMALVLAAGQPAGLLTLIGVPVLAWGIAHLRWRAVSWQHPESYILVRRGLLGRQTSVFPMEKVQTVTVRQSWFQRRRGLATLQLSLASGAETIPFIAEDEARRLANEAIYRIERQDLDAAQHAS